MLQQHFNDNTDISVLCYSTISIESDDSVFTWSSCKDVSATYCSFANKNNLLNHFKIAALLGIAIACFVSNCFYLILHIEYQ
jgi:hypothetical protein